MEINQRHFMIYVIIKKILLFLLKPQKTESLEDFAQLAIKAKEEYRKTTVAVLTDGEIRIRQEAVPERKRKAEMQELTEAEREDMREVERLLDENLFNYFFQPIVNAKDGDIYAYEALMRAKTEKKISTLQIIRYAGLMNRLDDVERLTFLNVLNYLKEHSEKFEGKRLFINSIPGTTLDETDKEKVDRELKIHSATAVVELTEEAELDDAALEAMKIRYKELGINTAVDDYGTGYSNIANLLRYMPQYVKIDRSPLSGIQDNPQKHIGFLHA